MGHKYRGKSTDELHQQVSMLEKKEKKVSWHTTFGEITVIEPIYRIPGKLYRPFLSMSGVSPRCCTLPLQRVITDFAADDSFGKSVEKIKEHYGIEISKSTIRNLTLSHAEK